MAEDGREHGCLAREERAHIRNEERRQMEMDFELRIKELEIERLRASKRTSSEGYRSMRPKIPKLDENHDSIDAYLERFERLAENQGWERHSWSTRLSFLLTGQSLEVYISLPQEDTNDYGTLKQAILKRFKLTEEGFRIKFRKIRPSQGDSVFQLIERLRRYFNRWTDLAGTEKIFQGVCGLLIKEQFIDGCSPDLAMFIKERVPSSLEEMTRLAEHYIEAQTSTHSFK